MKPLQLSLLSLSLTALLVGCSTDTNSDPLVPEIVSVEIDGADVNSTVHAIIIDIDEAQLSATVFYDDNTSANVSYQLSWESNNSDVLTVQNGLLEPTTNSGTAAISASYWDNIFTTVDKNITIIPLSDINITSNDINITELNSSLYHLDTNTTGSYTLDVYGKFIDNNITSEPISSNITWVSSNSSVASISSDGLLTIEAFDQNVTADINVSILNEVNATLELNITTP